MKFSASTNITSQVAKKHFHKRFASSLSLSLSRARAHALYSWRPSAFPCFRLLEFIYIPSAKGGSYSKYSQEEPGETASGAGREAPSPARRWKWTKLSDQVDRTPASTGNGHFRSFSNLYFLPWLLESKCCPEQAQVLCQESSHFVLQNFSLNRP